MGLQRRISQSAPIRGVGRWLKVLAIACTISIPTLQAQSSKLTDYDVKAAYLFNFGRFVEWPEAGGGKEVSFTFCILGHDPFGANLDHLLAKETIDGKHIAIKRISSVEESGGCHVLFMSLGEEGHLNKIIEALDKQSVLTVSDIPQFSEHGGMIQFVMEGERVRFEVNLSATQRAGLTLSSDLLKVATAVKGGPGN
jgi:hypothetical protein